MRGQNVQLFDPDSGEWLEAGEYYERHNIPVYTDADTRMSNSSIVAISATCIAVLLAVVLITRLVWDTTDTEPVRTINNMCNDGVPLVYSPSGELFGDANHDGVLSGEECNWE